MALFDKIRIMTPDQAAAWAEEHHDEIAKLDERTKKMLERKLGKTDDQNLPAAPKDPPASFEPPGPPSNPPPKKPQSNLKRFICNKFPNRWILVGTKEVRFNRGLFLTSDPELINAICNEPDFGLWILADDPELRKRYKRRR